MYMHHIGDLIDEKAPFLLPGEHAEGFRTAWSQSRDRIESIVKALSPPESPLAPDAEPPKFPKITPLQLESAMLRAEGRLKRSALARIGDAFLGYCISEPITEVKLLG
jgi:hypothetical protein